MIGYNIVRIGLVIYTIFACMGISGIQAGIWISYIGLLLLLIKNKIKFYPIHKDVKLVLNFILLFILWLLITTFFSIDIKRSGKSFIEFVGQICVIFAVVNIGEDEKFVFRKKLITLLLTFCVIQSIYGIIQYFTGIDIIHKTVIEKYSRIKGTLGYCNSLGGLLGMIIPVMVSYIIYGHTKKIILVIGLVISFIAMMFTFTRGAWVGSFVGVFIILVLRYRLRALLLFVIFPLLLTIKPIRDRIYFSFSKNFDSGRRDMWEKTFLMLKEKPWLGSGINTFQLRFYNAAEKKEHFHSHNVVLNTTVETGIIGGILIIILMFQIFMFVVRLSKTVSKENFPLVMGILGSVIDFYIHGLVDNVFRGETGYLFWFFIGMAISLVKHEESVNVDKKNCIS